MGRRRPFLKYKAYGNQFEEAFPGILVTEVQSKHFLQEDPYEIIAAKVNNLIANV